MDRFKWLAPFIIAIASFVVSGYANYNNNDKEITAQVRAQQQAIMDDSTRLDRVEARFEARLTRIEAKSDSQLELLRQILKEVK